MHQLSQQREPFSLDGLETLEDRLLLSGTPVLVADIVEGGASSNPQQLTAIDGSLFFSAKNKLWKTDGSTEGTVAIANTRDASQVTDVNGTIFFVKGHPCDRPRSCEAGTLWKIDASGESATRVLNRKIGPSSLFDFNGTLFFNASDGVNGRELWKSDGTSAGTVMVKDFTPNQTEEDFEYSTFLKRSSPSGFTIFHDELFFSAYSQETGRELWKTDGTKAGTVLVKDLNPGPGRSAPSGFTQVDEQLFFNAGYQGQQLWQTDGTRAGTKLVKDIDPGSDSPGTAAYYMNHDGANTGLTDVDGTLFFEVVDKNSSPYTRELWKSDGTTTGTILVKATTDNPSAPVALTAFKKNVFFFHSGDLWKSDGTDAGTQRVKAIGTPESTNPYFAVIGKSLFFSARDAANGFELWHTDGTERGTTIQTDFFSRNSPPEHLTVFNDTLLFAAKDQDFGRELFKLVPGVTLSSKPTVGEGRAVRINATLTSAYNKDVTVNLRFSGSARKFEYIRPDTKIVIPAGKLTRSIVLKVKDDSLIEGTERIVVSIDSVTDDLRGTNLEPDARRTVVRIVDNDRARIVIRYRSSVGEHPGTQSVGVKLLLFSSNGDPARLAPGVKISVKVVELGGGSATKGVDYREFGSQLVTFNPSNRSGTIHNVRFTPLDDRLVEGNETVNLRLQGLRSSLSGVAASLDNANSILTIRDND